MAEKRKCPVLGTGGCNPVSPYPCGHCQHCGWPLDNHKGLGLQGKSVDCPKS